uniref:Uncharacterized protein n=1 Tax=Ascaris lumbricoides TaxID=6252 RepID=A0A0M3HNR2_ASCLU
MHRQLLVELNRCVDSELGCGAVMHIVEEVEFIGIHICCLFDLMTNAIVEDLNSV